ncbi:MAG: hypothetical protein ACFLMY_07320 [Candidatus Brachytrichaceae bacterium NZ_4S206]|jgi:hypothetical protein
MFTLIHILFGAAQLALAVVGIRHWLVHRSSYGLIAILVIAALVYDNLAIAAGALLGEGDALKAVNTPRYIFHSLLTPLLIIFACGVARRAGLQWSQSRAMHAAFCILATLLVAYSAYVDVINLRLEPARFHDTLRYSNEFSLLKGPPLPAFITMIVLVVVGAMVWIRTRWPWLFAGALAMLILAGAGTRAITVANLGEVFLSAALVATVIAMDGRIPEAARARSPQRASTTAPA